MGCVPKANAPGSAGVSPAPDRKTKNRTKRKNMQITVSKVRPSSETKPSSAPCALENRDGFWELTIDGQTAVLPQNHALFFVATLLGEQQPISIADLARKVFATYANHPDFIYGGAEWLRLHFNEAELAAILRLKVEALEKLLERQDELEILKAEAQRELEAVCDLLEILPFLARRNAGQSAAFLFNQLQTLRAAMARAVNLRGEPNEPIRHFAILCHLLIPTIVTNPVGNDVRSF
jgi:hypothetical protein